MAALKLATLQLVAPFAHMLQELLQRGFHVWVVGGWVRDCMRGVEPHDADLCTNADAAAIEGAAKAVGITILLDRVAAQHGIYRLAAEGSVLDLARLRRDVAKVGARHAEVSFAQELEEDLSRRDLTINAMALPYPLPTKHARAALVDLHGGAADLQGHTLRLIGDAHKRLEEDPLRLLRIARFACMAESWAPEAHTQAAMAAKAPLLAQVSVERRLAEVLRALALPQPARFWQLVLDSGAHTALLPSDSTAEARARAIHFLQHASAASEDPRTRFLYFVLGAVLPSAAKHGAAKQTEARTPVAAEAPAQASASASPAAAGAAAQDAPAQATANPTLVLRPSTHGLALAWMAPLRFAKAWQHSIATLAAAWVLADTSYEDEDVVRWALSLGPQNFADFGLACNLRLPALTAHTTPSQRAHKRATTLLRKRNLWRGQDLQMDAQALFAQLEVPEGAIRRWLLTELLVHTWLHPKDNNAEALARMAAQFNPTQGP